MAVLNSQLRLTLLDQVTARARGIMGTMRRMQAMARRTNASMRGMLGGGMLGGAMRTAAPFVGIYAAGRAFSSVVGAAANFEQSMNRVNVLTGATATQFAALEAQAKELGRTTQFSASEAADAMGFLAMAGFEANDILGAMPGTLQLAAAAQMDLAQAADITSNVLTGYNKDVSELAHVNDVLVKAFTSANTDLAQLGEAMKYVGPIANTAGVRFEETAAAVALMGNAGIQGSMAGTTLRRALSRAVNPTKQVRAAMQRAGLSFTNAEGRLLPLADIIEQMEPHAEDAGLFMELFGDRAGPGMATLVQQGSDGLRRLDNDLQNSGGTAQTVADAQMRGFEGAMRRMRSATEGVAIAIGERLNPSLQSLVDGFTAGASSLVPFIESFDNRVTIFDSVGAAYRGFVDGVMSGDGNAAIDRISRAAQSLKTMVFGSDVPDHQGELHRLREMSEAFRKAGENFAAFANSLASGDFRGAIRSLSDAFSEMNGWGTFATVFLGAKGIGLLAAATWAVAMSPIGRLAIMATAVAELIDAFKGAESFGEFVRNLGELSGVQWALIAAGVAMIAAKVWSLAAALGAVKLAGGLLALTRGAARMVPSMAAKGGAAAGAGAGAGAAAKGGWLASAAKWAAPLAGLGLGVQALGDTPGSTFDEQVEHQRQSRELLQERLRQTGDFFKGLMPDTSGHRHPSPFDRDRGPSGQSSVPQSFNDRFGDYDFDLSSQSLAQMLKPGDQVDANIVNPPPRPNVTINNTVNMQSGESPEDVGRRIGQAAAAEVSGTFSDGGL